MTHRKDIPEERAIALLNEILAMDETDRDALPGSAVALLKRARRILVNRRVIKRPRV